MPCHDACRGGTEFRSTSSDSTNLAIVGHGYRVPTYSIFRRADGSWMQIDKFVCMALHLSSVEEAAAAALHNSLPVEQMSQSNDADPSPLTLCEKEQGTAEIPGDVRCCTLYFHL